MVRRLPVSRSLDYSTHPKAKESRGKHGEWRGPSHRANVEKTCTNPPLDSLTHDKESGVQQLFLVAMAFNLEAMASY